MDRVIFDSRTFATRNIVLENLSKRTIFLHRAAKELISRYRFHFKFLQNVCRRWAASNFYLDTRGISVYLFIQ